PNDDGAASTARPRFGAMVGDVVKSDGGIDLAGLPADDCAICFHGLTSETSAATTLGLPLFRTNDFFSRVHDKTITLAKRSRCRFPPMNLSLFESALCEMMPIARP